MLVQQLAEVLKILGVILGYAGNLTNQGQGVISAGRHEGTKVSMREAIVSLEDKRWGENSYWNQSWQFKRGKKLLMGFEMNSRREGRAAMSPFIGWIRSRSLVSQDVVHWLFHGESSVDSGRCKEAFFLVGDFIMQKKSCEQIWGLESSIVALMVRSRRAYILKLV